MRSFAALACVIALSFASARAEDKPTPLTHDQVKQVADGLAHLDKYDKLAKDGPREFIVPVYFEFKKGLRGLIADDLTKARAALRDLNDKNNELVRQYARGGDKVADENMQEFAAAQRKLLDSPSGVVMAHIKIDELDLDTNKQITAATLSLLDPILDK